jgi:hypothetical protein
VEKTPVAVSPVVRLGMRTVQIKWTWGKPCFLIVLEEHTVRVMQPPWAEQSEGCLFYFDWLCDSTIKAYVDPVRRILITRNDRVAATVVPLWKHVATNSYRRTIGIQIAEIYTASMLLEFKLVCDVFCNYFPGRFRILSGDGLRICYWQRTGGFGRGGAKVVVSRRVHSELLPIILAIATAMLMDSGGD